MHMTDPATPLDDTVTPSPHILARRMDPGAILMNTASGDCFELNPVGARVWDLISRGCALEAILDELVSTYAIDRATARGDLQRLLDELAQQGIVRITRR
jgi:hypothetical protein